MIWALLNAAKVMSSSQVELPKAARSRTEREIAPQGLKPSSYRPFSARLKSCPDTKHFSKLARNRLTRTKSVNGGFLHTLFIATLRYRKRTFAIIPLSSCFKRWQ